jgi:hypothetical protein
VTVIKVENVQEFSFPEHRLVEAEFALHTDRQSREET